MFSVLYANVFYPLWHYLTLIVSFFLDYIYIWLPLVSAGAFAKLWLGYVRLDFLAHQKYFLVEVKIPREVAKTPLAMEVFLSSIWQKGTSTYIDTYWSGKVQPWYSLEMVSIGGQIKFFIWGFEKYRPIVEAQLYAQYPDVEIIPSEDYTDAVVHDLSRCFMWGTYFKLTQKDVYPI